MRAHLKLYIDILYDETQNIKYHSYTYKIIYTSRDAKYKGRRKTDIYAPGDVFILSLRR